MLQAWSQVRSRLAVASSANNNRPRPEARFEAAGVFATFFKKASTSEAVDLLGSFELSIAIDVLSRL
jgi:hypothetical protein